MYLTRRELKWLIREKQLIRKQISKAIDHHDYETARYYMSTICKRENEPKRKWTKDEEEYLILHIEALGIPKACEIVSKKLNRGKNAVRTKYYDLIRRGVVKNENGHL